MIKTPIFPLKRTIAWILAFWLTLILTLSWSHAQESEPQPPKDWQLKGIMAALDDPDKDVWVQALDKLGTFDLKPPFTMPPERYKQITGLLDEKEANYRAAAAKALGSMGEAAKDQIPAIAKLLQDKDGYVRYAAAEALGSMGEAAKDQIPAIIKLLQDEAGDVSSAAAEALGSMGEAAKDQIPAIAKLLQDEDENVRSAAAEALGSMGAAAKDQIPAIAKLLQHSDVNVRVAAVEALGNMGAAAKDQIPAIAKLLQHSDVNVRVAAVEALGNMGAAAKDQIPAIAKLLQHEDGYVRSAAVRALGSMGAAAKDQIPAIAKLLQHSDVNVRVAAVEALGNMGEAAKDQTLAIAKLLQDEDWYVRSAAAKALGSMGEAAKDQIPAIAKLLQHSDVNVRVAAVEALGNMGAAAKDQIPAIAKLLQHEDGYVRSAAVRALGSMGAAAKDQIPAIAKLLQHSDVNVRVAAVEALGNMGAAAKDQIPAIAKLLQHEAGYVRSAAAQSIEKIAAPISFENILPALNAIYTNYSLAAENRFYAYYLSGGNEDSVILIRYLGLLKESPKPPNLEQGRKTLNVFANTWKPSESMPQLREDLANKIATVVEQVNWKWDDIDNLWTHYLNLKAVKSTHAAAIKDKIDSLEFWNKVFLGWKIWLAHLAFWLLLIFAYPKSPQIQAIFFWNPWVRRITGLGYVGFVLTWVPFFRDRLFSPFKDSLLADADLKSFKADEYFPQSKVLNKVTEELKPLPAAIPAINGQIILQGESGLGKSMFVRHLAKQSQRILVYLRADRCTQGVTEAIQKKLHGQTQDPDFLRNLIYSGAIDICIDGLNEVTADTRAKITEFVESYFKGNIIMTTQPLEWRPPATASFYLLQPLEDSQIQEFLLSRSPENRQVPLFKGDLGGSKEQRLPLKEDTDYETACEKYLKEALREDQPKDELDIAKRILSNPMDLTIVAQMLQNRQYPDLFHLQQQQYTLMAKDYQSKNQQDFPLKLFSETVYQMRLNDEVALPASEYYEELQCLQDHKMVISQQSVDVENNPTKEWKFRHDKILEYFIVQTFLGKDNERPSKHISDPRFRGVYFLLAILLPLDAALEVREELIQYAADTHDNTVSNEFVRLLRSR